MPKSTKQFLNQTENLFNVLSKLQSVKISVIAISLSKQLIEIEAPANKQLTDLGYKVASKSVDQLMFVSMGNIKIAWKEPATALSVLKPKRRWRFL